MDRKRFTEEELETILTNELLLRIYLKPIGFTRLRRLALPAAFSFEIEMSVAFEGGLFTIFVKGKDPIRTFEDDATKISCWRGFLKEEDGELNREWRMWKVLIGEDNHFAEGTPTNKAALAALQGLTIPLSHSRILQLLAGLRGSIEEILREGEDDRRKEGIPLNVMSLFYERLSAMIKQLNRSREQLVGPEEG